MMSSQGENSSVTQPRTPREVHQHSSSLPINHTPPLLTRSTYLINDIPRGTPMMKLVNYLIAPPHWSSTLVPATAQPHVQFSCKINDSRLDDDLSVAMVEFTNTPQWLQLLNLDPEGFPKKTSLGTIWHGVDPTILDAEGRTEFMRAVIANDLLYAEALAEFQDSESQGTDVNVQDIHGRTALHWACAKSLPDIVMLCLSVPECDVGLRDNDNLTAFDISLQAKNDLIPNLFYKSSLNLEANDPQSALLRVLTMSSDSHEDKPKFPGAAIFDPIEDRNLPLVKALIGRGVDLTARNANGDTALHLAAAEIGNTDIVRMLLEAGADVNATGAGGTKPLYHAADDDTRQLLQEWKGDHGGMLVEEPSRMDGGGSKLEVKGADRDTGTGEGTVARLPTRAKDKAILPALANVHPVMELKHLVSAIEHIKGYMELKDEAGRTALLQRTLDRDLPAVLLLIERGASLNANDNHGDTSLHVATTNGHTEIVTALLVGGVEIEKRDTSQRTALHLAAENGHTEIVTALIVGGAQIETVNKKKMTALHLAAVKGHTEIVSALIIDGAQIEAVGEHKMTALHLAAQTGHTETVTALIIGGAQIEAADCDEWTALHLAAKNGHTKIVTALIIGGAQIEATGYQGRTALLWAAGNGHTETVTTLIIGGAHIEATGNQDMTALFAAARKGHTETVTALILRGAQIEAVDKQNSTALHVAAEKGHTEIVTLLLANGAKVDARQTDGMTALHLAARGGVVETVQILLDHGARLEVRSKNGTAFQLASKKGHQECAELLAARGAQTKPVGRLRYAMIKQLGLNDSSKRL